MLGVPNQLVSMVLKGENLVKRKNSWHCHSEHDGGQDQGGPFFDGHSTMRG